MRAEPARDSLKEAQDAYNSHFESQIRPLLSLTEDDDHNLGFADIARRITDSRMRSKYVQLAMDLMEANIRHYTPLAARKERPRPDQVSVVVSTLLIAAAGYYFRGPVIALLAAAGAYWLASKADESRTKRLVAEARAHDDGTHTWQEAIEDWKRVSDELRCVPRDI